MKAVVQYLKQHQKRFVHDLCDYVRFPSISAKKEHKADVQACATWLAKHCKQIGLEAKVCATKGHPVVLARTHRKRGSTKPHFVIYGHYDVQPPEPLDLWKSPPFKPRISGKQLFARGASDNKGQNMAHLKAVEAYLNTSTELPCDLTFIIEGEEEVGSHGLSSFLKSRRKELACDAVVISDTGMPDKKHPAFTYALRGVAALEVKVTGPTKDLHSGIFGGSVENPAMVLCQMLAQLRNDKGKVLVPGFYDDVVALTKEEREELAKVPFNERAYRSSLGAPKLFGEHGFTPTEQRTARPTLEINGLTSGYQGEGSKTIVPSTASAKITCRLVPNQTPAAICKSVTAFLKNLCPDTVRLEVTSGHGAEPYLVSPDGPLAQASLRALKAAFGQEPVLLREGGSIPIVTEFQQVLKADSLLLGLGLPDDNPHSPNEKFDLECFERGQIMSAHLWQELAGKAEPESESE